MRVFLTGATGFIGSYVLRELLSLGYPVTAHRRSTSAYPCISLHKDPRWITSEIEKLQLPDLVGHDVLIHLASAGVPLKKHL